MYNVETESFDGFSADNEHLSIGHWHAELLVFYGLCASAYQIYRADQPNLDLPTADYEAQGPIILVILPLCFNNVGKTGDFWNEDDLTMANRISDYWTGFAKTGDPNGRDQPTWETYAASTHNTMMLNLTGEQTPDALREKVDLLAAAMAALNKNKN